MDSKYKFTIQIPDNGQLNIPLTEGKAVFVLGANGVGKSTLMHNLFLQNLNHSKRIVAHRQTWFTSNAMNMTAFDKKENEKHIRSSDQNITSRWKDDYSGARSNISIFDLINSQNIRSRNIADAYDAKDFKSADKFSNEQAPLQAINELLAISNIPIKLTLGKDEQLFASKNGSEPYSIAELSDGERNALLIGADVLTTEPNTLIILDEPERHLHRSIISPLLSTLFQKRKDCVFVISTHDVYLPLDHNEASVLLLRNCQRNGKDIFNWDADLISESDEIPNEIKRDILGSKRELLFVEGENESLDRQIYQLIFPTVSVLPQGSCVQVEKAVEGIRKTENLHWINVYGLIDADDRTPEQIQELSNKGIAALNCFSVEALYYNLAIINKITERTSELTGEDKDELFNKAISGIVSNIQLHKQRLCSRICEKRVRNQVMSLLPKHQDIAQRDDFEVKIDMKEIREKEELFFDKLINENSLDLLLARYPIRETPVLDGIVRGLGLTKDKFESAVRKLIVEDEAVKDYYKNLLSGLTALMNPT